MANKNIQAQIEKNKNDIEKKLDIMQIDNDSATSKWRAAEL